MVLAWNAVIECHGCGAKLKEGADGCMKIYFRNLQSLCEGCHAVECACEHLDEVIQERSHVVMPISELVDMHSA